MIGDIPATVEIPVESFAIFMLLAVMSILRGLLDFAAWCRLKWLTRKR